MLMLLQKNVENLIIHPYTSFTFKQPDQNQSLEKAQSVVFHIQGCLLWTMKLEATDISNDKVDIWTNEPIEILISYIRNCNWRKIGITHIWIVLYNQVFCLMWSYFSQLSQCQYFNVISFELSRMQFMFKFKMAIINCLHFYIQQNNDVFLLVTSYFCSVCFI